MTAYLGLPALEPPLAMGARHDNGIIVVARSSNPEGATLQSATTFTGSDVADRLLAEIAALQAPDAPYGLVGALVGGTNATARFDLAGLGGPVLAPGFGAHGATDHRRLYGS